jgi:hypothetical protein
VNRHLGDYVLLNVPSIDKGGAFGFTKDKTKNVVYSSRNSVAKY